MDQEERIDELYSLPLSGAEELEDRAVAAQRAAGLED